MMTVKELEVLFERYDEDEYLSFERIETPLHKRREFCAMLLLDKLCPDAPEVISAAEHDIIYFGASLEGVAAAATEQDVLTLVRCGVMCGDDTFTMYV